MTSCKVIENSLSWIFVCINIFIKFIKDILRYNSKSTYCLSKKFDSDLSNV